MKKNSIQRIFVVATALFAWACTSAIIPATGERRFVGLSWEQERQIGQEAAKEIAAVFGLYREPELQRYVERVGQRVLAASHLRGADAQPEVRETPITFQILDSPSVNAMAIPGGRIYVTRGLLAHLISEDQLAFVLAHEVAHISARHGARRAWQQQLGQGLLLGGAILGDVLGLPAQDILNLGGTAAQLLFLRYSRGDEFESDGLAVEYTLQAGYNPLAAQGFFRALSQIQEQDGGALPNFLSTHPNPGNRIERLTELAQAHRATLQQAEGQADAAYLDAIEGIVLGDDPRQGFVQRNVFYHPELRFRFPVPAGFRLVNQPGQVIMIDNQRRAIIGFQGTSARSAAAATEEFLRQPGIRERNTIRASDPRASGAILDAQNDQGQLIRMMVYFVEQGGRVYRFLAYAGPQTFDYFQNEFLKVMRGFAAVSDPAILRRQPVRMNLQRAARAAPLRTFIPAQLPVDTRPEEVAILNQIPLSDTVERGRLIKLPATG